MHDVLARFRAAGATAVCVAEAFAPDDSTNETPGRRAGDRGRSAGLRVQRADRPLRARAAGRHRRAQRVDPADRRCAPPRSSPRGVAAAGIAAPVMVMRGDGGATDLAGFRRGPRPHALLRSGGVGRRRAALRAASPRASSSRSAARRPTSPRSSAGGPLLSYVQVASHATALRALDVRVIGVAGGSMLRVRKGTGLRRRAAQRAHRRAALRGLQPGGGVRRRARRAHRAPRRRPGRLPRRRPGRRSAAGPDQHLRGQRARHHAARRLRARGRHRGGRGLRPGRRRAAPRGRRGGPPDAGGVRAGRGRARRPRRWRITT